MQRPGRPSFELVARTTTGYDASGNVTDVHSTAGITTVDFASPYNTLKELTQEIDCATAAQPRLAGAGQLGR